MLTRKIIAGITVLFLVQDIYAAELLVPSQYSTIQAAINAASDGDIIRVYDGTYYENIYFGGKAITVCSTDPNNPSATVIDGSGDPDWPAVYFNQNEKSDSVLKGFTVRGGYSGVWCYGAWPTISNCIIEGYSGTNKIGIYHTGNNNFTYSFTVKNSIVKNNYYGLRTDGGASNIENNLIYSNANRGIYADIDAVLTIERNKIYSNGYGIFSNSSSTTTIRNNLIYDNTIGIYAYAGSTATISNNTIAVNNVGISTYSGTSLTIYNCILWNKFADNVNCSATYSCIKSSYDGTGNISSYPYFADYDGNDFHLTLNSPCINKGDPCGNYIGETDIDGESRVAEEVFVDNRVDMGADEICTNPNINLVKNPGFEDGNDANGTPLHWIDLDASCQNLIDDSEVHSGGHSWKFTNDGSCSCNAYADLIPVEYGKGYKLSAWVKRELGTEKIKLNWRECDVNGNGLPSGGGGHFFLDSDSEEKGPTNWIQYGHLWEIGYKETKYIRIEFSGPSETEGTVWWDDFSIVGRGTEFLPPYGCVNEPNIAETVEFGGDEKNIDLVNNINVMSDKLTDANDNNITYRELKANNILTIGFPAFNVAADYNENDPNDMNSLPLEPMLLEVMYRDTYGYNRAYEALADNLVIVTSKIDYINLDPDYLITDLNREHKLIHLGGFTWQKRWRYTQYGFPKSAYQLIRAIEGKFTIKITNNRDVGMPIDYISLIKISNEEYEALVSKQRDARNFKEVQLPTDSPSEPNYSDPNLTIFVRDIMRPVYQHTKPGPNEIDVNIVGFSTWGEVEPMSFAIYSENGVNDVNISVSNLERAGGGSINSSKISIYQVVYDENRLPFFFGESTWVMGRRYALLPDRLEEFSKLSIEPNTSKRVWLKVRVPDANPELPAGLYEGQVTISRPNKPNIYIPIDFTVYDITLDLPAAINAVWRSPYFNSYGQGIYSSDMNVVFEAYQETGFDPFGQMEHYNISPKCIGDDCDDPCNWTFDSNKFKIAVERMVEEGYAKDTIVIWIESGPIYKYTWDEYLWPDNISASKDSNYYYILNENDFKTGFGLYVEEYITAVHDVNQNLNVQFFVADEPGRYADRRILCYQLYSIMKDPKYVPNYDVNTTVTYHTYCDEPCPSGSYILPPEYNGEIPPLTDLVDYKVWGMGQVGEGYRRRNDPNDPDYYGDANGGFLGYSTTGHSHYCNPIYNRFLHGLFAFGTDATAIYAYAMGSYEGDPYNDFDPKYNYVFPFTNKPDWLFAYPTWSGELLYTIGGLEGIREGIKDARYIATLKNLLIAQNPNNSVAKAAQDYLNEIKSRIDPNYAAAYFSKSTDPGYYWEILKDVSEVNDANDYEAFTRIRKDIAEYIVLLSSLASQPNPADEADNVDIDATLSWTGGKCALSYDVYLGTEYTNVNNANPSSPEYKGSQDTNSFDPNLSYSTNYYWRIDSNSAVGTAKGNVWSFTTIPDTTPPTPNPLVWASVPRSASSTSITMTATTASDASPPVQYYFECTTDGNKSSSWQTSETYVATGLNTGTAYTFRVKARDSAPAQNETDWSETGTAMPILLQYVAAGNVATGTTSITPALPSGISPGDIFLLFVETANQAVTVSNHNGGTWAQVTNSPQGTGTAGGTSATRLTAFWSRYNGTQGAPTASVTSGNHQIGRITAYRGVVASGNPWDVTAGNVASTASASVSIPGETTTVADTLVVVAVSNATDKSTAQTNNWANSNLTGLTERADNSTTTGNGGGFGVATGSWATAGVYGTTTATLNTSSVQGRMSIALKPGDGIIIPPGQASNPTPSHGATYVSENTNLSWTAGSGATSHLVYFGTNPTPGNEEYRGEQTGTTYDPPEILNYSTAYYWRIDEKNVAGTTTGAVWSFTTIGAPVVLLQDGFETNFDKWTDGGITDWDRATNQKYSGSYSAHAGSADNDLISDNINTSGYAVITITFWYRDDDIDDDDNIYLQLYNGSTDVNRFELGVTLPEDTWHQCIVKINNSGSDAQYFIPNFRIKFEGTSIDTGENLWIDDVNIIAQ